MNYKYVSKVMNKIKLGLLSSSVHLRLMSMGSEDEV